MQLILNFVEFFYKFRILKDKSKCGINTQVVSENDYDGHNKIELFNIPPGFTNLLLPADVIWFRSFKRSYHEKWTDLLMNGTQSFTVDNNLRSPGFAKCRKFDRCGITSNDSFHTIYARLNRNEFISDVLDADEIDGFDPGFLKEIFDDIEVEDLEALIREEILPEIEKLWHQK
ncbi:unnamed protein product [Brachionus calyciflorus]|uniref:Uncharacterized protein n=1 Tax=Brachionus calyciflorus TaxID=104777 RepID=A0A813XB78_9BILA|nr:unnamed protein product [Brachionus calyciflorus]